jgi:hypothetical protein
MLEGLAADDLGTSVSSAARVGLGPGWLVADAEALAGARVEDCTKRAVGAAEVSRGKGVGASSRCGLWATISERILRYRPSAPP